MAVAFRSVNSSSSSVDTTSVVVTKPSGTASGDILIAGLAIADTGASVTPPSGFTQVGSNQNSVGTQGSVWVKVAGGSEPASYTFSWTPTAGVAAYVAAYSGGDSTIVTEALAEAGQTNGPFGNHYDDAMHITVWMSGQESPTITNPSGMTERADRTINGSGSNFGRITIADVVLGERGVVEQATPGTKPSNTKSWGFTLPPDGGTYRSLFNRVGTVAIDPRITY